MKKLEGKDFVMIGGFLAIGIIIYVFFFTSLGFGGDSSGPVATEDGSFSNFQTTIESKEVDEYSSKEEAYAGEMKKEEDAEYQRQQKEELKSNYSEQAPNDLGELLQKEKTNPNIVSDPVPDKSITTSKTPTYSAKKASSITTKATTKSTASTVSKSEAVSPTSAKKKRRGDPTFGDQAGSESAAVVKEVSDNTQGEGVIHKESKVKTGSSLRIRVTESFSLASGCEIKQNTFLDGYCSYSDLGRLVIKVKSLMCDGKPTAVKLTVYDGYDGQEGLAIRMPTDEQQVGKEIVQNTASEIGNRFGVRVVDQTVTSASGKKMSDPSVIISDGYKLIVKEDIEE